MAQRAKTAARGCHARIATPRMSGRHRGRQSASRLMRTKRAHVIEARQRMAAARFDDPIEHTRCLKSSATLKLNWKYLWRNLSSRKNGRRRNAVIVGEKGTQRGLVPRDSPMSETTPSSEQPSKTAEEEETAEFLEMLLRFISEPPKVE
jgi:hypothetical protein